MIETADGNTVYLMTEEWVELARNLTREDFQVLALENMKRLDERLGLVEAATSKAITELKRLNGNRLLTTTTFLGAFTDCSLLLMRHAR